MKKSALIVVTLAGLCFFFSGMAIAKNTPSVASKENKVSKNPQCADLRNKLKVKKLEIEDIKGKMKTLNVAQKAEKEKVKQAKLEGLKKNDPKKYQRVLDKQVAREQKKKALNKKGENKKQKKPKLSREERLERLKQKNPEMYELVMRRDSLVAESKVLRAQLKDCKKVKVSGDKVAK